jgi:hypothetical protein
MTPEGHLRAERLRGELSAVTQGAPPMVTLRGVKVHHFRSVKRLRPDRFRTGGWGHVPHPEQDRQLRQLRDRPFGVRVFGFCGELWDTSHYRHNRTRALTARPFDVDPGTAAPLNWIPFPSGPGSVCL